MSDQRPLTRWHSTQGVFTLVLAVCLPQLACDSNQSSPAASVACAAFTLGDSDAVLPSWPLERSVPENVEQALAALDEWLSEPQKQYYRCLDLDAARDELHFGLALWIRNNWGLFEPNPLTASLAPTGLRHPDDVSNLVAYQYVRRLHGEPLDVEGFARPIRDYWQRVDALEDDE